MSENRTDRTPQLQSLSSADAFELLQSIPSFASVLPHSHMRFCSVASRTSTFGTMHTKQPFSLYRKYPTDTSSDSFAAITERTASEHAPTISLPVLPHPTRFHSLSRTARYSSKQPPPYWRTADSPYCSRSPALPAQVLVPNLTSVAHTS